MASMNYDKSSIASSYANKVNPSLGTKTTFRKVEDNMPRDADYDVGLPIASVLEIHERLKNSLYGYFIGKRLAFPAVEWLIRNN
ncbi:ATPase, F1/V1/A1 complex, alpha/beta subunit, Zinc knuckle CX2CX4HX4C [Artemisia annua]|uniref:ATPase, F1/V1/A1 complex, alpha/beta subunit, Zinc knuckle CX2CX4HX4C n=1 Tax=Artemisia annua TaxID=35608 RepID=A0A2U1LTZ9_ARTAN|nr:ATPase, F1/V1/A1 complex, alpha/beta subunit, Zinc knuckle CX2CX4HX4C [Artemisia annua]